MFDNYTERAKMTIMKAQQLAMQMGHSIVGTEHLLLSLAAEEQGVAAKVLAQRGISAQALYAQVKEVMGANPHIADQAVPFSPRIKRVLELAAVEAREMGHNYVGTEHLLLGLLREGEGIAARLLQANNISLENVYTSLMEAMGQAAPHGSGPMGKTQAQVKGKATPVLDSFGRDLTKEAAEGKLDPVIGREKEVERVIQVLSRRTKNNPCLIGEPGVGKTAIAEGLAQRINAGQVPELLRDKRLVTLELSSMVAGTKYRGEFEERFKKMMDELKAVGNVILFIDELHTLIGAGGAEGALDAANIIKPALSRGELQAIGATTLDEYRKYIEKDAALERRFQPITVGEPAPEEAVAILKGLRDRYEAHHRVKIPDDAIEAAVKMSARYIPDRFLPDKAIDLIDEAASRQRLLIYTAPPDLKQLEQELEVVEKEMAAAVSSEEYEKAAQLRDRKQNLQQQLKERKDEWENRQVREKTEITPDDIAHIVSSWTGIPVTRLAQEESQRLLNLEAELHKRVIGQQEAVHSISRAVRRARAGLKDPKRPIGSFIFLGPTGVGKTELARALAEAMFGDEDAMIRLDMSEYMEKHTTARLIGAPPGYVGYDEGGQLTEKVRRRPYSVILLDEIEKAHPDVFNTLLQVLEDGILTDGQGRRVDFRNTIIIMTSNVGAHLLRQDKVLGFRPEGEGQNYENMKEQVTGELKRTFRPEFLNRIDDVIVFHALDRQHIHSIVDLMLAELAGKLKEFDLTISVTEAARNLLVDQGFDPTYGARPLRRAIQRLIEDEISEELLKGSFAAGENILVDAAEGKLTFSKDAKKTEV
ncbi:MAG: ATP-dependent Clp protease ATP-binding subunit [Eubacteriales bacterium]|nr:ATP-dependent Clp protease ATP-binding subunit [Eubacteriales bacterium]MDD3073497.1 ATP-dependent Clp protease ATP-binding subunit [Eubacteriales bacterium]MDD4078901.1 ATP-dependent Clp protease ATP-binding subunit [Eubacteriales bacterium]MDD4769055.1 ATP-dependent Clp protease ATP-binding subunit [Eubacteriales bacterium]